jgi:hypothetical protein
LLEEVKGMVVLLEFVEGPDVLLVEINDGDLAYLSDVDENGVKLGGVVIFLLAFLLVVDVHLSLREIDVP